MKRAEDIRKGALFETGGSASRPPGFNAVAPRFAFETGASAARPESRHLSRRSSCFPAALYPPLRYTKRIPNPVALVKPDISLANKSGQLDVLPTGLRNTPPVFSSPDCARKRSPRQRNVTALVARRRNRALLLLRRNACAPRRIQVRGLRPVPVRLLRQRPLQPSRALQ
jgi:hypothetical protein